MTEMKPVLQRVRDALVPREGAYERLAARRARKGRVRRISTAGVAVLVFVAGAAGVWAFLGVGERVASPVDKGSPASPSVMPSTNQATCELPVYWPSYLPWLQGGDPVPAPSQEVTPAGEGPEGLDPGYSTLVWGFGDVTQPGGSQNKGTVAFWRSTESVGATPADPEVPALPDGAVGRLIEGEGGGWSIVWEDTATSLYSDSCNETTLVLTMPNLTAQQEKDELISIAESMVQH